MQQNREVSSSLSSQQVQPTTPSLSTDAIPIDWESYPYNSCARAYHGHDEMGRTLFIFSLVLYRSESFVD